MRTLSGRLLAVATVVILPIVGCSENAPLEAPEPYKAATLAAVHEQAPDDWATFQGWVEQEIQKTRELVPLPTEPNLPEPRWRCVRLADLIDTADIASEFEADDAEREPLLTIGPFRSDRPTRTFLVKEDFRDNIGTTLLMVAGGFRINADDVGTITLKIKAPWGQFVDLRWSPWAGQIRMPVPDNEQMWTLNLATDGLIEFKDELQRLFIRSDGMGAGVFEIEAIEFYGHESAYPHPVGVRRATVERARRDTIYMHAPAEARFYTIDVPENGRLTGGLAAVARDQGGATDSSQAVDFTIAIETADGATEVLSESIAPDQPWHDFSVALDEWAGQTVTVALQTASAVEGLVGLWSNVTVYEPVEDAPLVILYLIDTLAAKHMELYGYERETTPHITKLGERGVWFQNTYANSPVTVMSVPDTQLSMSAERHGVIHESVAAPLELMTIADVFRAAGFATASFITNPNAGPRQNMDQGFEHHMRTKILLNWEDRTSADRTVPIADVRAWMAKKADRPMLVYVHTCEPHQPYTPPPGFADRFDPDYDGYINGTYDGRTGFHAARTKRDIEHIVALYDEECYYADHMFGEYLAAVDEEGLLDRANVIVLADHGEELQEHGHWGHGYSLYNEVMKVPLVMAGPAIEKRGQIDIPANLYDVMPTMLDMFDLPRPYALFGTSLMPLVRADGAVTADGAELLTPERTIYISHHRYKAKGYSEFAVVEANRWKIFYRYMLNDFPRYPTPARWELYDLQNDPGETKDVFAEQPEVARRLMSKLVAYCREQYPYDIEAEGLEFDAEQLRELRSLGYIGD